MISVVIPSYNSRHTIYLCITSLLQQTCSVPYEIIVVDSSIDGTDLYIQKAFPNVNLIHLDYHAFAAEARNIGIQKSKNSLIAFLDSDCIASKKWLNQIVVTFKDNNNLMACGGSIIPYNDRSLVSLSEYFLSFAEFSPLSPARRIRTMPHCNVVYRKSVFKQCGKIDNLPAGEDTYFNNKLGSHNIILWFNPLQKVQHIHREGFIDFVKHQYFLGKGFAENRHKVNLPGSKAARLKLYPILSVYKCLLMVLRMAKWHKQYLHKLPLLFPIITAGLGALTAGNYVFHVKKSGPGCR